MATQDHIAEVEGIAARLFAGIEVPIARCGRSRAGYDEFEEGR
jgi:hypothetical protein